MLRKMPLKTKTPLRAKTPLKPKKKSEKLVEKKVHRKRRTEPNYVADMDKVFQFYIRLRDVMPGGYGRCISCGKIKPFDHLQAGHFFGRAHFSTRWHEDNVNAECEWDNCWNGEHLLTYKENLIKKIGIQRFKLLELTKNQTRKWTAVEIKIMIKYYAKQIMQLSASKHIPVSKGVLDIIIRYEKKKL